MKLRPLVIAAIAAAVAVAGVSFALAQQGRHMMHGEGMGQHMMRGEGMGRHMMREEGMGRHLAPPGGQPGGMGHGLARMLQGEDIEPTEIDEMRAMFTGHPDIRRTVTNLPDGIETVTSSDDPDLAGAIVSHVVGMIARVEDNRDPKVFIQSPTLDILFANRDLIRTEIVPTETGVRVIQRSDDPATVAALQRHAAEVSDMAERGVRAVHEAMMQR